MNRSCCLALVFFLAGLVLKAGAQQTAPAAAPAASVGGNARGTSGPACGEESERCGHRGSPRRFAL